VDVTEEEFALHGYKLNYPDAGNGKRTVRKWKRLLVFPSDEVLEETLISITQLQVDHVEAERRQNILELVREANIGI